MCRSIKTLFNFAPPATDDEVKASALQFVRKLSGYTRPSKINEAAFERAVKDVAAAAQLLLESLVTKAEPKERLYTYVPQGTSSAAESSTPRSAG